MDISIVGAGGEVGRALATHLLSGALIGPSERLQLVGHGHESGERKLLAERCDLLDAFDESAPAIEIAGEPDEVSGNLRHRCWRYARLFADSSIDVDVTTRLGAMC